MLCKANIALAIACMLNSTSVRFAASRDDETGHHRNWTVDKRAGPTSRHPQVDLPLVLRARNDGEYRAGRELVAFRCRAVSRSNYREHPLTGA